MLTATVEERVLSRTVVLRGEVGASRSYEVTPNPGGESAPIVTAVNVKSGSTIKAGKVVLEVGGRPLIVLPGSKPAYRNLRPGYSGPDVAQLQAALRQLGYDPGDVDGEFGASTKTALTDFYAALGYEPVPTAPDDAVKLDAAKQQVTAARRALDDAKAALAGRVGADRSAAVRAVERAREDLATADKAYKELAALTGPTLPLSEYVFLPSFPARVDGLQAKVGAAVSAPAITLASGALQAEGLLSPADHELVKVGMRAELASETVGEAVPGRVAMVGELVVNRDDGGRNGYPIVIVPDKPLAAAMAGLNVRMTVTAASTSGSVLVVPVSALVAGANGTVSVIRRDPDGTQHRISVDTGLTGDGYVAITATQDNLSQGDTVVVGIRQ
ncbi:peptidoglycan-binding protein [Micromonospora globbae]|uniref:peptidoglycan-binding protein n=1 Tax=Micromonospora globbae TaxID=1894969 RepID=UPI001315AE1B|nr:peptidoglycan-binding protein [Micromonospora globbae]